MQKQREKIVSYIKTATGDIQEVQKGLFAIIACRSAIKSGDVLDAVSAKELVDKVFRLDAMLCPHGRSFVFEITKDRLFKEVGRII